MKLTAHQKGKKVYLKAFAESLLCHPETLVKYHRYLHQEIDAKTFDALKNDNLYYHTFSQALKKLSYKSYAKKALEEALDDAPFPVVKRVITELEKLGYLDDQKLLRQHVEDFHLQARSLKSYQEKLLQKGFFKRDITHAFKDITVDETAKLKAVLEKKASLFKDQPLQKQKEKLQRYALSLGYSYPIIDTVIRSLELIRPDELKMLQKELQKYPPPVTYQDKEKLKAKLFRRGYALRDIDQALKEES